LDAVRTLLSWEPIAAAERRDAGALRLQRRRPDRRTPRPGPQGDPPPERRPAAADGRLAPPQRHRPGRPQPGGV